MDDYTRFVGWDVHKDTIHAAVAERGRTAPEDLGSFPNTPEAVKRWLRRHGERWGSLEQVLVCYAAGPCGYVLCKQLEEQGVVCLVVAPSLIPRRLGDRVKTDRRDALRLASLLRAGELTPVWVPDATHEAFRGLLRAREAAVMDRTRARHRVSKFLLARGHAAPAGTNWGTERHELAPASGSPGGACPWSAARCASARRASLRRWCRSVGGPRPASTDATGVCWGGAKSATG